MPKQEIVWTALPNGTAANGTRLRLSILVAPRLDPQTSANRVAPTFPNFVNWPQALSGLGFRVEVNGGPSVDAQLDAAPFDAALWGKVFRNGDVPVVPFTFNDVAKRALRSFPVRSVAHHLRVLYSDIGKSAAAAHPKLPFAAGAHPALVALEDDLGDLVDIAVGDGDKHVDVAFGPTPKTTPSTPRALPPGFKAGPFKTQRASDFYQADRFYRRVESREGYDDAGKPIPASPKKPELDFHQILAAFSDHPQLLRRLGIVIDITIPAAGIPANAMLRVALKGTLPTGNHRRPWTHYELGAGGFFAAPRGANVERGFLRLAEVNDELTLEKKSAYDIVTLDPDGSALKAIHFALTLGRLTRRAKAKERGIAFSTAEAAGLPALQSNGVALVEVGRAWNLGGHLIKQAAVNGAFPSAAAPLPNAWGDPRVLHAEDLLRGYRADVQDLDPATGKAWRSLMRRVGDYTLALPAGDEKLAGIKPDEGYVKAASASSKDGGSDLYLHETLFKWTGWSLASRPPARAIEADPGVDGSGNPIQRERVRDIPNESGGDTPLEVEYRAEPRTLPRLRFGHTYKLRARTVDLVGNSLPHDDKTETYATQMFTYRRWEPVLPPALLPRDGFGEGASLERMVLRSNYDVTAQAYAASAPVQAANAGKHYAYRAFDDRHVVPPKTAQITAETHGAFDAMIAAGAAGVSKAYKIAAKEAGHYLDTKVVDVATGNPTVDVAANLKLLTPPGVPASPPPPSQLPLKKPDQNDPVGETLAPGQYVVYPVEKLHLPYLPDPIGRGVTLRGLPNAVAGSIGGDATVANVAGAGLVAKLPWKLDWPDAPPFRIVLRERPGAMPAPGGSETVACQEVFSDPGRPVWDPAQRTLTVFLGKAETARILYSSFLDKADLDLMAVWRWIAGGASEAQLRALAEAGCHWMLTPFRELELVHAVQEPLCVPRVATMVAQKDKVGDTHAFLRGVLWRLSAKSTAKVDLHAHWSEWLDDVANPAPVQVNHTQLVLELPVALAWGDESTSAEIGADRLKHQFADTHYRLIQYNLVATTRFREYFPASITADPANISRTGPAFMESPQIAGLRVPNSARPAAPRPLYVVPTFRWSTTKVGSKITSVREGRGLRVWLERPWFSSGDGELLGVILDGRAPPAASATAATKTAYAAHREKVKPCITQWGKDPLFASANPKAVPAVGDFPLAVKTGANLTLDELPPPPLFIPIAKRRAKGAKGRPGAKAATVTAARVTATTATTTTAAAAATAAVSAAALLNRPVMSVAGHKVEFDTARRLWFSDIEVNAGGSYWPFIRLALARYQPESRSDCHLSRVILSEFVQLLPDRRAVVTIGGDRRTLTVEIFGIESTETGVSFGLKTDAVPIGPGGQPLIPPTQRAGLNEFDLVVEKLDPALGNDFGWSKLDGVTVTVGGGGSIAVVRTPIATTAVKRAAKAGTTAARTTTTATRATAATTRPAVTAATAVATSAAGTGIAVADVGGTLRIAPTFKATVKLAAPIAGTLRLVVKEFELHYEDVPDVFLGKKIARRLVYADTIALT